MEGNDVSNSNSETYSVVLTPASTISLDSATSTYIDMQYQGKISINASIFFHELSHQLGAPDHYCRGIPGSGCINRNCDACYIHPDERAQCCMNEFLLVLDKVPDQPLYCTDCINTITAHVNDHH